MKTPEEIAREIVERVNPNGAQPENFPHIWKDTTNAHHVLSRAIAAAIRAERETYVELSERCLNFEREQRERSCAAYENGRRDEAAERAAKKEE